MSVDGVRASLRGLGASVRAVRSRPRRRAALGTAGVVLGLLVALVHWGGFLLAGLVIGIVAGRPREAGGGALVVGAFVTVTFLGYARWHDQLDALLGLGELTVVSLAIPFALLLLGASVRLVT